MPSALGQQQRDFRSHFKREVEHYLDNTQKRAKKDSGRVEQFRSLAEEFADRVSDRFGAYAAGYKLDKVATVAHTELPGGACLKDLEAVLQSRSEEVLQLRTELLEKMKAASDEQLIQSSLNMCLSQPTSLSQQVEGEAATKTEQLQLLSYQIETVLAEAHDLAASNDEAQRNNHLIEEQRSRPLHPMEELLQCEPVQGIASIIAADEADEEQLLQAEVERSQKMSRRMQHHFDEFA